MRRLPAVLVAAAVAAIVLAANTTARADSFTFSETPHDARYRFGAVTVLDRYDYRDGPLYSIEVRRRWRTLGRFEGASFVELYADPAHGYFVGVSNWGIPDTSVIVFDAQGNLVIHWGHSGGWIPYCRESVTVERRWLDEPAAASFEYVTTPEGETQLRDITLTRCNGERFSLDEAGGGDLAIALAEHRKAPTVAARAAQEREACAAKGTCPRAEVRFAVRGGLAVPIGASRDTAADDDDEEDDR
jgi:hypothetical protein